MRTTSLIHRETTRRYPFPALAAVSIMEPIDILTRGCKENQLPQMIRAKAQIIGAEAQIIRATPQIIRAKAQIIRATPKIVRAKAQIIGAEAQIFRAIGKITCAMAQIIGALPLNTSSNRSSHQDHSHSVLSVA